MHRNDNHCYKDNDEHECREHDRFGDRDTTTTTTSTPEANWWAWECYVFGTKTNKCIHYIWVDSRTAPRCSHGALNVSEMAKSDHRIVGQHLNLTEGEWNAGQRMRRSRPKAIRWRVNEGKHGTYTLAVENMMAEWNSMWGVPELTDAIQGWQGYGHGHPKGHMLARRFPTEAKLNEELKIPRPDDERWTSRQRRYEQRELTKKEKKRSEHEHIFQNLREGGWGKKDMSRASAMHTMPFLQEYEDDEKEFKPVAIGRRATDCDGALFGTEGGHERARASVKESIEAEYDAWEEDEPERTYINDETVGTAQMALKAGCTCSTDGLPSEAWQAAAMSCSTRALRTVVRREHRRRRRRSHAHLVSSVVK